MELGPRLAMELATGGGLTSIREMRTKELSCILLHGYCNPEECSRCLQERRQDHDASDMYPCRSSDTVCTGSLRHQTTCCSCLRLRGMLRHDDRSTATAHQRNCKIHPFECDTCTAPRMSACCPFHDIARNMMCAWWCSILTSGSTAGPSCCSSSGRRHPPSSYCCSLTPPRCSQSK